MQKASDSIALSSVEVLQPLKAELDFKPIFWVGRNLGP